MDKATQNPIPRLAIISTHPIQYNAPLFRLLASEARIKVRVFYTLGKTSEELVDKGFGKAIKWDIPLLEGYDYQFLNNISLAPSTSKFKGIVNPTILKDIEAFNPTDMLVFGWSFDSHLKVLRYFKNKVNVYFRGDSTLLDETNGIKKALRRVLLTWVYSYPKKAFYVGSNNKKYFLKHGVKESNLVFAPHAIDNDRFGNDALYNHKAESFRRELGIPEENIVFLFIGKFETKKNPLLLIKAFKKIDQRKKSLLFVGNGRLEQDLKREAEGYDNIHFLPFQNQTQMPLVYRVGDVLVLPSSGPGETWGLCINEAMACGLPVIASNKVGCAVDLVQEDKNGYTFEAMDTEDLQDKLGLCLAKSKEELEVMGQASKKIIAGWNYREICTAITATVLDTV